jgi:hypothetical protein
LNQLSLIRLFTGTTFSLAALAVVPAFAEVRTSTSISNLTFQAFRADGQLSPDGVAFQLTDPSYVGNLARTISVLPSGTTNTFSFDPNFLPVGAAFGNSFASASSSVFSSSFATLGTFTTQGVTVGGRAGFTTIASMPRDDIGLNVIGFTFLGSTTRLRVVADATYAASVTGGNGLETASVSTTLLGAFLTVGVVGVGPSATVSSPYDSTTGMYLPNAASFSGKIVLDLFRAPGDFNSGSFGVRTESSGFSELTPVPELPTVFLFLSGTLLVAFRLRRNKSA